MHLIYVSQIFAIMLEAIRHARRSAWRRCSAIIRGLRGDKHMGNFYLDLWRVHRLRVAAGGLIVGMLLMAGGTPMTLAGKRQA